MQNHIYQNQDFEGHINKPSLASSLKFSLALLILLLYQPISFAEIISQPAKNGLVALADYRPGDDDKPALLILHGFLQTHNFSIIQSLSNEMADNGYTILAPTLTLGIDRRKQSITCEMIQTHQYGDHHTQLDSWINWLYQKGHKEIILVGHSTGAVRILSHSSTGSSSANKVTGLILISPTMPNSANNANEIKKQLDKAYSLSRNNNNNPDKFTLAYCVDSYISSASAFISYASISENTFFDYIKKSPHPVSIIVGSNDKLVPDNWFNKLKNKNTDVIQIKGANHFYTNGHEFDLFDAISTSIQKQHKQVR